MKYFALIAMLCAALALSACGGDSSSAESGEPEVGLTEPKIQPPEQMPKKLVIRDIKVGTGPAAERPDDMTVRYLAVDETGKVRFSSWDDEGKPAVTFKLGQSYYFPAWDEGVKGMKVGGRRELVIPASGTGQWGKPLIYVIDLLKIE